MGNTDSHPTLPEEEVTRLSAATHFTAAEVVQWHRGFMRDCPSGRFTMAQYQAITKGFFPNGDGENFAKFVFNSLDLEEDASLNFENFLKYTSMLARGTTQEKQRWAFHLRDIDHAGTITKEKMRLVEDSIFRNDANHVPLPEDENTPETRTQKLFDLMDADKDGNISLEEFKTALDNDHDIVNALALQNTVQ
uniref:EF-hand domain-containing protein n=1 Tax=Ciona savignyi TaxID=51511 RepID=H2YT70_CIOSA